MNSLSGSMTMVDIWDSIIDENNSSNQKAGNVLSWNTANVLTNLTIIDIDEDIIYGKPHFEALSTPMNFYDGKDSCEKENMDIAVASNLEIIQAQT